MRKLRHPPSAAAPGSAKPATAIDPHDGASSLLRAGRASIAGRALLLRSACRTTQLSGSRGRERHTTRGNQTGPCCPLQRLVRRLGYTPSLTCEVSVPSAAANTN